MGMRSLIGGAVLLAGTALATPRGAGSTLEFVVDQAHATVRIRTSAAPDVRSPSAAVGRVSAERTARARALTRLRAGLAQLSQDQLGCRSPESLPNLERAVAQGELRDVEWGSDGSLEATLEVRLGDMVGDAPNRRAEGGAVILVDIQARPRLFVDDGRGCAAARPAPPVFASLAELRRERPELAGSEIVERLAKTPLRVVAVIREAP